MSLQSSPSTTTFPLYHPGDIAFVKGTGPISWLIRRLTRSHFSHVRIIAGSDGGTIEAIAQGVIYGQVDSEGDVILSVPFESAEKRDYALNYLKMKKLGEGYSFLSFPSDLLGYLGFPLYLGLMNQDNCCELALRFLQVAGLLNEIEYEHLTPQSLYVALQGYIEGIQKAKDTP